MRTDNNPRRGITNYVRERVKQAPPDAGLWFFWHHIKILSLFFYCPVDSREDFFKAFETAKTTEDYLKGYYQPLFEDACTKPFIFGLAAGGWQLGAEFVTEKSLRARSTVTGFSLASVSYIFSNLANWGVKNIPLSQSAAMTLAGFFSAWLDGGLWSHIYEPLQNKPLAVWGCFFLLECLVLLTQVVGTRVVKWALNKCSPSTSQSLSADVWAALPLGAWSNFGFAYLSVYLADLTPIPAAALSVFIPATVNCWLFYFLVTTLHKHTLDGFQATYASLPDVTEYEEIEEEVKEMTVEVAVAAVPEQQEEEQPPRANPCEKLSKWLCCFFCYSSRQETMPLLSNGVTLIQ